MRKLPIFIIPILILSFICSPVQPTFAAISDLGTTWWSVAELLEFYPEVEASRIATCGDDFECNMNFEFDYYERSDKYRALQNLLNGQIWVTSINPAAETISVLFFDDDMMLKRMGIQERIELEYLYFGWFDEKNNQDYYHNYESLTGPAKGLRLLYVYNSEMGDVNVIVPWQETKLSAAGGNLIDNTTGKINYSAFAKYNMFNAHGSFDYSSCLRAEDYIHGAECRLMISGDQGISYFPPREPIKENNEDSGSGNPNSELSTDDQTTSNSESNPATEPDTQKSGNHTSESAISDTANNLPVRAPETGTNTFSKDANSTEFPWWFLLILALGSATFVWLFYPFPKNDKKDKKTLDKKPRLR